MKKGSPAEVHATDTGRVVGCGDLGRVDTAVQNTGSAWSLWLWVAAGFLFLGLLWTGMVIATRQADTRTVPLAKGEAKS